VEVWTNFELRCGFGDIEGGFSGYDSGMFGLGVGSTGRPARAVTAERSWAFGASTPQ
jgi:hypothetical protein